ncbi:GNAT family N-acetyltransferase [Paractinoplanes globisporus]|uniref:GNAT family N-acetyltransferase n=1 Tax=Paractinoplanes globisporus TaxID=113565 RepID=A0ABW6WIE8_9ACTN|nr:GNAT family N-acetyltransferase [Actinoplanes globisporus]
MFARIAAPDPYDFFLSVSLLLVATDPHGAVIGVLMALPPVQILGQARQAGVPIADVRVAAKTVVKIKAVAVAPDARGAGVGSALIDQCLAVYTQLGWRLIYGQIDADSTLDVYYSRLGFAVLDRGQGIDLDDLLGFPLSIHSLPVERLFLRRTPDDGPGPAEPGSS